MKLTLDNGKEIELSQELSKQLEKVVDEATKEERKDIGFCEVDSKNYCYIAYDGSVDWDNGYYIEAVENLNAFTTQEFAEKIAFKQLMERKLLKFSLEHYGYKINWDDDTWKYYIFYYGNGDLRIDSSAYIRCQGTIYFYSHEIAQAAIDEFHDDLIKYFQLDFSK